MSDRLNRLRARVEARNLAAAEANRIRPLLREFFASYVGKKVLKADGSLLKSIDDALNAAGIFPVYSNRLHVYRSTSSHYSLTWVAKSCVVIEGAVAYEEAAVYIATLSGADLSHMNADHGDEKCNYTVEEIQALRKDYEVKKRIADDAKSALYPFGEFDQ